MTIGFDADVLIYAATADHPKGAAIRAIINSSQTLVGSTLLMPEVLIKPTRLKNASEQDNLKRFLAKLELTALNAQIANTAVYLGSRYGLKTVDAAHLATAIYMGAEQFLTNNRKDFKKEQVLELAILHPDEL